MARYPMVVKGQKFVPNLHLENDLRRMVNATKRTGGKGTAKTFTIRIPVYNAGTTVIASGTAVNITGSPAYRHSSSPCLPFYDDKLPWGVLANSIDPQECGSCIISGPANVQISGSNGDYVQPNKSNPEVFIVAQSGVPVISKMTDSAVINLGASAEIPLAHQFQISDASTSDSSGNITPIVRVTGGVLNGVGYDSQSLKLAAGKFWIYAVNGAIYALNHEFASDFFSVLLCGTVEVAEDMKMTIEQISFQDNPFVESCGVESGAIALTGVLAQSGYTLTAEYTVTAKGLLNNKPLEFPSTKIPESTSGHLLAYIKSLDVEADSQPESGFEFSNTGLPSKQVAWYQDMFRYVLTPTKFEVLFRQQPIQMFTFTRIFLNASETEHGNA